MSLAALAGCPGRGVVLPGGADRGAAGAQFADPTSPAVAGYDLRPEQITFSARVELDGAVLQIDSQDGRPGESRLRLVRADETLVELWTGEVAGVRRVDLGHGRPRAVEVRVIARGTGLEAQTAVWYVAEEDRLREILAEPLYEHFIGPIEGRAGRRDRQAGIRLVEERPDAEWPDLEIESVEVVYLAGEDGAWQRARHRRTTTRWRYDPDRGRYRRSGWVLSGVSRQGRAEVPGA